MLRIGVFSFALLAAVGALIGCDRSGGEAEPEESAAPVLAPLGPKVFPLEAAPALDHPGRDEWQRPDEVIAALEIRPGQRVADIGCGTGYFTLRLVRAVGPDGHVLAADIQQGMLDILSDRLDERLDERGRALVELRLSAPERPLEATDRIDLALLANTLHEVDEPGPFLRGIAAGLEPGGRLAVINWLATPTPFGPPLENRISAERVAELAAAAGLSHERDIELLRMHSFQVFRKSE